MLLTVCSAPPLLSSVATPLKLLMKSLWCNNACSSCWLNYFLFFAVFSGACKHEDGGGTTNVILSLPGTFLFCIHIKSVALFSVPMHYSVLVTTKLAVGDPILFCCYPKKWLVGVSVCALVISQHKDAVLLCKHTVLFIPYNCVLMFFLW